MLFLVSSLFCKLLRNILIIGGVVIDLLLILILVDLLLGFNPGFPYMRFTHANLKIVFKLCWGNDLIPARQRYLQLVELQIKIDLWRLGRVNILLAMDAREL